MSSRRTPSSPSSLVSGLCKRQREFEDAWSVTCVAGTCTCEQPAAARLLKEQLDKHHQLQVDEATIMSHIAKSQHAGQPVLEFDDLASLFNSISAELHDGQVTNPTPTAALVRRGRGTHVVWACADKPVSQREQDHWKNYLEDLRNGRGYAGKPETMAEQGIDAEEVASWPDDLKDTDERTDWSMLSHTDSEEARQEAFDGWRERRQKSKPSIYQDGVASKFPRFSDYQHALWTRNGGEELEELISSGAIALVDAHWLVHFYEGGGRALGRRQELPLEAFITLDEIKAAGTPLDSLPIVVQSYMWLQPSTPDPQGHTLSHTIVYLKALTCQRPEQLRNFGASTYGPCGTQRFGVFVDWLSLHQKPRSEEQDSKFKMALGALDRIYSHPHTIVIRCTKLPAGYPSGYDLPKDANVAEYYDRGWTYTESAWSNLVKTRAQNLDLGALDGTERPLLSLVQSVCTKGLRQIPLLPNQFDAALAKLRFTNGNEDKPLCSQLYRSAFNHRLGSAIALRLNSLSFDDSHMMQLACLISSEVLAKLEVLKLHTNAISGHGVKALSASIDPTTLPRLHSFNIGGNRIGDEGAKAIAMMMSSGSVPLLKELDVRNNQIGPIGLQDLADAIASGPMPHLAVVISKKNLGDDRVVQNAVASRVSS